MSRFNDTDLLDNNENNINSNNILKSPIENEIKNLYQNVQIIKTSPITRKSAPQGYSIQEWLEEQKKCIKTSTPDRDWLNKLENKNENDDSFDFINNDNSLNKMDNSIIDNDEFYTTATEFSLDEIEDNDEIDCSRNSIFSNNSSISSMASPIPVRVLGNKSRRKSYIDSDILNFSSQNRNVFLESSPIEINKNKSNNNKNNNNNIALEKATKDIINLKEKLSICENKNNILQQDNVNLKSTCDDYIQEIFNKRQEVESLTFLNSILEQKNNELEQRISQDMLDQNEEISSKNRKHKSEIKKLNNDRLEYEERANQMMCEMNEQMSMLQTMAMKRIEELENNLLEEGRKSDKLKDEIKVLQTKEKLSSINSHNTSNRQQSIEMEEEEEEEGEDDVQDDKEEQDESDGDESTAVGESLEEMDYLNLSEDQDDNI